MTPRLINAWHNIRTSFWFVPAVMATAAIALAFAAVQADRLFATGLDTKVWLWSGSPDGAREVLSTIASSMITVAGVTFSVTVVALTMAASQFGPRLLRNFMRDTGNQVVLGTFVSTFLYCLLVLRSVHSSVGAVFVPQLATTLALVFAVLAVAVLIYFIHHVASSLQVETLVASIADDLMASIGNLFPENLGHHMGGDAAEARSYPELQQKAWSVRIKGSGYVQAVDDEALMALAKEEGLVLRLLPRPGSFVSASMVVMEVRPADTQSDAIEARLARMITLGRHRTMTQDAEFPAQQIVSIALRALSPAINDPFTAMICIDWLGSALLRLAGRKIPCRYRGDEQGQLRVVTATTTFVQFSDLIFNPIRRAAHQHPTVLLRMLEKLHDLALYAIRDDDRRAISEHAERLRSTAYGAKLERRELERIEEGFHRIKDALHVRRSRWQEDDGDFGSENS